MFVLIFTVGEYVAVKTKANVDVVLFVAAVLLIGFWMGLPASIYEMSGILPMAGIIITLLIVGMGNMIDFAELKRQWKTVCVSIIALTAACICGKIFGIEPNLAIVMCLTCMYGFPATMYLSKEVAEVTAKNETEKQAIENYLLPKMNIAGFVTGSFATVLAGIFGGMMQVKSSGHRRPYFDQITVQIIKSYNFLSPAMCHEPVNVLN